MEQVFVSGQELGQLIEPPVGSPRLLVGRKGVGKSALLVLTHDLMKKEGGAVHYTTVDSLELHQESASGSLAALKSAYLERFTAKVAAIMGDSLHGFIPPGYKTQLYEASLADGRQPDKVRLLAEVLQKMSINKTGLRADVLGISPNMKRLRTSLIAMAAGRKDATFTLFVDDTDQISKGDRENARLWAFLLAARNLNMHLPQLRLVISFRSEVWERLNRPGPNAWDQVDQFRPLVSRMECSEELIGKIVKQRLVAVAHALEDYSLAQRIRGGDWSDVFSSENARLPQGGYRSWPSLIETRSRTRPRDALQLLGHLANTALSFADNKIGIVHVQPSLEAYSEERADDIAREFEQECKNLRPIMERLATYGTKFTAKSLKEKLGKVISGVGRLVVRKKVLNNSNDDILLLWDLLFEADVLNAKIRDPSQARNFRNLRYMDHPRLLHEADWNQIQETEWSFHPAYLDFAKKSKQGI